MAADDLDHEVVDRLVRKLDEPAPAAVPVLPPVVQASAQPAPERPARPVSRWTNVRILMPGVRAAAPRRTVFASAILPHLPMLRLPTLDEEASRVLIVRGWVTLGVLLSLAMPYWPYQKTYLLGLLLYLFAVSLVVVAGVWSAKLTWDVRLGGAHTISLGVVFWAIVLVTAEALPPAGTGF